MDSENYNRPSDAFVRGIDVHTLLPQREPFVMVGCLEHFDMVNVATSTAIAADNIFVEDNRFSASGLIENIAQTCAARIGYINKYILKRGIQIGFIGSVRNMCINELPLVGQRIYTEVVVREEVFGMLLADATVTCNDQVIVSSEIIIAVKE